MSGTSVEICYIVLFLFGLFKNDPLWIVNIWVQHFIILTTSLPPTHAFVIFCMFSIYQITLSWHSPAIYVVFISTCKNFHLRRHTLISFRECMKDFRDFFTRLHDTTTTTLGGMHKEQGEKFMLTETILLSFFSSRIYACWSLPTQSSCAMSI